MRVLAAIATISMLTLPAIGQQAPPSDERITLQQQIEQREKMEQERRDRAAETEKAYQRLLKSSGPAPAAKVDPWGNVRGADPAQSKQNSQFKNSN
jgi:hypothetical protein